MIEYKCLCCNKSYQQNFNEKLNEQFLNTYKFYNYNNNKLILMLIKGVYAYEYLDVCKKINEISLPENKTFMEDITHADYVHVKRVEIKDLVEYHDCMFKEILYF